eukprot:3321980-Amphidinium_carterae.1
MARPPKLFKECNTYNNGSFLPAFTTVLFSVLYETSWPTTPSIPQASLGNLSLFKKSLLDATQKLTPLKSSDYSFKLRGLGASGKFCYTGVIEEKYRALSSQAMSAERHSREVAVSFGTTIGPAILAMVRTVHFQVSVQCSSSSLTENSAGAFLQFRNDARPTQTCALASTWTLKIPSIVTIVVGSSMFAWHF